MKYFSVFPKIQYLYVVDGVETLIAIKDIALNIRFKEQFLDKISLYDLYDIEDGERPEDIANKFYGKPELSWVIMLFNDRFDHHKDFPLSTSQLERYIDETYGVEGRTATHMLFGKEHYINADGFVVDNTTPFARRVTNYEYEVAVNEAKRRIKLPRKELLNKMMNDFIAAFTDLSFSNEGIDYV